MPESELICKEVGWNGIRISVPVVWETDRLGERYILMECEGFPVLEIKWNKVKGKFSPHKHLKRIKSAYHNLQSGQEIHSWTVPQSWFKALSLYNVTGFQWKGGLFSGKGLILFCKFCNCATFLQFYEHHYSKKSGSVSTDYKGILSSFKDHNTNGLYLWSVFDIRIELPQHFQLIRHSFVPGSFELIFEAEGYRVSFYRWSPASVILCESDLQRFAQKVFPSLWPGGISKSCEGSESLEWMSLPPLGFWKKWYQKLRKEKIFKWVRMWHIPEANRILAVKAERNRPMDIDFLKKICFGYGVI